MIVNKITRIRAQVSVAKLEKELTVLRAKVAAAEKLAAEFAIASEFFAGPPFVHLHGDTPLKRSIAALAAFRK